MFTFLLEEPGVAYIPAVHGLPRVMEQYLVELLTIKLYDEVSANDLTRAVSVKAGKEQQKPTYNTILVHKNDPRNAKTWAHQPVVRRRARTTDRENKYTRGLVGSNAAPYIQRAFTIEFKTALKQRIQGIVITPDDADQVLQVVMSRAIQAITEAGPMMGAGNAVVDSFGEQVHLGPFFEDEWTDREQGKSLRVQGRCQIWYLTSRD